MTQKFAPPDFLSCPLSHGLTIFMIDSPAHFAKGFRMKVAHAILPLLILLVTLPATPASSEDAPFRHFVSFQFKEGTTPEKQDEPLANGFTHSFLVTFKDKAGLAAYLPHPAHEAFVAILKPHLEKVYVFDYTAKK
jgi:hypothetical protein